MVHGEPVCTQKGPLKASLGEAAHRLGAGCLSDALALGTIAQQQQHAFEQIALTGADEARFPVMD